MNKKIIVSIVAIILAGVAIFLLSRHCECVPPLTNAEDKRDEVKTSEVVEENVPLVATPVSENEPLMDFTVLCTYEEKRQGLSGRESIGEREALLFVYDRPQEIGIWMKEMNFPIDIYWLDEEELVIHKEDNVSPDTYPEVFESSESAQYVIETGVGAVDIEVGETFSLGGVQKLCEA